MLTAPRTTALKSPSPAPSTRRTTSSPFVERVWPLCCLWCVETGVVIFKSYVTDLLDPAQETLTLDAAKFVSVSPRSRFGSKLWSATRWDTCISFRTSPRPSSTSSLAPAPLSLRAVRRASSAARRRFLPSSNVCSFLCVSWVVTKTIETTSFLDHCLFKDQAKDLKALRDQIQGYFHIDTNREEDRCTLTFYGSSEDLDADYVSDFSDLPVLRLSSSSTLRITLRSPSPTPPPLPLSSPTSLVPMASAPRKSSISPALSSSSMRRVWWTLLFLVFSMFLVPDASLF